MGITANKEEKILKCAVEIKEGHRDVISSEETA